jgi:hypothetical protein
VLVYEHLDGTPSLGFGAHEVGRYSADGTPLKLAAGKGEVRKAAKRRAA